MPKVASASTSKGRKSKSSQKSSSSRTDRSRARPSTEQTRKARSKPVEMVALGKAMKERMAAVVERTRRGMIASSERAGSGAGSYFLSLAQSKLDELQVPARPQKKMEKTLLSKTWSSLHSEEAAMAHLASIQTEMRKLQDEIVVTRSDLVVLQKDVETLNDAIVHRSKTAMVGDRTLQTLLQQYKGAPVDGIVPRHLRGRFSAYDPLADGELQEHRQTWARKLQKFMPHVEHARLLFDPLDRSASQLKLL